MKKSVTTKEDNNGNHLIMNGSIAVATFRSKQEAYLNALGRNIRSSEVHRFISGERPHIDWYYIFEGKDQVIYFQDANKLMNQKDVDYLNEKYVYLSKYETDKV